MNTHNTLAADAAAAADAVAQVATNAADRALRGSQRLAGDVSQLAHQGSDAVAHTADVWRAQARHWQHSTRSYIEHEPVKATLIAMAAGAALVLLGGLLLRGRHDRH